MAENAKDSDERDLRGGRCCAPVRLVDQERRAELDRLGPWPQLHRRPVPWHTSATRSAFKGARTREERQSGDDVKSMLSNGLRGSANSRAWTW